MGSKSLSISEVSRRGILPLALLPASCGLGKPRGGAQIEGRWEGKLSNGLSALTINFDFIKQPDGGFEFRINQRDLFLSTHPIKAWSIEGKKLRFELPLVEGTRTLSGTFGGPTFDLENPATQEKIHLRKLGHIPSQPYRELGLVTVEPTMRSARGTARIIGRREAFTHFYADMLGRMGFAVTDQAKPGAGWVCVEDGEIPPPILGETVPFLILISPGRERVVEAMRHRCPLLVLLGEADERFEKLERGTRQVALEFREGLEKQQRKDYQISVIPKADATLRIRGFGREYPRLPGNYIEYFRRFFARPGEAIKTEEV
jgi:hypothetical protein